MDKIVYVRLFLSMLAVCHRVLISWTHSTFLYGDFEDEVYMEQPHDFVAQRESSSLVC